LDKLQAIPIVAPSPKDPFRVNLVKISRELKDSEWNDMASMYEIPGGIKQNFKQAIHFFDYLLDTYSKPIVINELQQLLKDIGRENLLQYLKN